jgi:hypothetical protein
MQAVDCSRLLEAHVSAESVAGKRPQFPRQLAPFVRGVDALARRAIVSGGTCA